MMSGFGTRREHMRRVTSSEAPPHTAKKSKARHRFARGSVVLLRLRRSGHLPWPSKNLLHSQRLRPWKMSRPAMSACVRSVTLTAVLVGILSWHAVGPAPDPVAHAQAPAPPRVVAIVGASVVDLKG